MNAVFWIAKNTFLEAVRQKFFNFLHHTAELLNPADHILRQTGALGFSHGEKICDCFFQHGL